MLVSVVMPVYNERETLEQIVRRVFEAPIPHQIELLVVDDGSTDGTRELYPKLREQYADKPLARAPRYAPASPGQVERWCSFRTRI